VLFIPGGQSYLSGVMNSLIHVVMYSYYALSAVPVLRKYLWWKRYLTQMQLTQFVIIFTHISVSMYRGCDTPFWGHLLLFFYMLSLMVLFGNFYIKQYLQKRRGLGKPTATAAAHDDYNGVKVYRAKPASSVEHDNLPRSPYARQPLHNGSTENGHSVRNGKKKEA